MAIASRATKVGMSPAQMPEHVRGRLMNLAQQAHAACANLQAPWFLAPWFTELAIGVSSLVCALSASEHRLQLANRNLAAARARIAELEAHSRQLETSLRLAGAGTFEEPTVTRPNPLLAQPREEPSK